MASELERLLLSFEADTRKLKAALADSEAGVDRFEKKADSSLSHVERRFERFGNSVASTLKGVIAAQLARLSFDSIMSNIADVSALQKTALVAGITAERLQELRKAAGGASYDAAELDSVMVKFAGTMGEVRTKTGEFYNFLRLQAPGVLTQLNATKSQSEAFDVVANTVQRLTSAEDKALFTKKALGDSNVLLVSSLTKGAQGFRDTADAAKAYGLIVSEDAVKATAELKKEIGAVSDMFTANLQQRIGDAAPALAGIIKGMREEWAKWELTAFGFKRKADVVQPAAELGRAAGEAYAKEMSGAVAKGRPLKLTAPIADFSTELDFGAADAMAELRRKYAEATADGGAVIREEYAKDVEAFRRMLAEKKISEQEFQMAREQLSVAMGAKIAAEYEKETQHVREQLERVKDTIDSTIMKGFDDTLRSGKVNFGELIRDMAINITKLGIQAQITKPLLDALFNPGTSAGNLMGGGGGFSVGGLISAAGSLLGGGGGGWQTSVLPGRAAGGPVSAGQPYIVGERRPELFVPNTAGRIMPNTGGGGSNVVNIDARGADIGVEQRLRGMFSEMQRSQQNPLAAMTAAQRRFPTRKAA